MPGRHPLVANPAPGSPVREAASYITPLPDDPARIEDPFAPGACFLVPSVDVRQVDGKQVRVITLQVPSLPGTRARGGCRLARGGAAAGSARVRRFALRARWPHSVVR